jgi:hypothetical protein
MLKSLLGNLRESLRGNGRASARASARAKTEKVYKELRCLQKIRVTHLALMPNTGLPFLGDHVFLIADRSSESASYKVSKY